MQTGPALGGFWPQGPSAACPKWDRRFASPPVKFKAGSEGVKPLASLIEKAFREADMSSSIHWKKNIRKASYEDTLEIRKHLLSLDEESVKSRFGNTVTRAFLQQYVETIFALDSIVFLCEFDGFVRGVGELRPLTHDKLSAEAAFTVDAPFRDLGIGTALMAAAIEEASQNGVREIFSYFDVGNRRMVRIAAKFRGGVACDDGDCIARIGIDAYPRFWRRAARLAAASAVRASGAMARASEEFGCLVALTLRLGGLERSESAGGAARRSKASATVLSSSRP
jgi:N-acetylglutamate synthase-like GNAT family acetyltransferase